ncbi:MAG: hypothetical protein OES09_10285 [Gammaproteobacteria bacterium]|nr:hypothetical protein [Gammaproteobacteria bacterium]
MLTFSDCLSYCGLTEDEINVIAHHERITELVAIEFADSLLHTRDGEQQICDILADEMHHAEAMSHTRNVVYVRAVLDHYLESHPRCSA